MNIDERCTADFIDCTVDCELPAGHEGDHEGTVTWPQSDPARLAASSGAIMAGYAAYLRNHYGRTL